MADGADRLADVLANLVQKIGDGASKYGPDAINLTQSYLHIQGIMWLCFGVAFLIVAAVSTKICMHCCRKAGAANNDEAAPWVMGAILTGAAATGFTIAASIQIFNPPNWIAAYDGRLAMVYMAIETVKK